MTDLQYQEDELVLELRNERPITATDLSQLLGSLARDYRQINPRHELVVARIVEGSLLVFLRDLAAGTAGANSLITFGKTIASIVNSLMGKSKGDSLFPGGKKSGIRTVQSLTKIAVKTRSQIEIRYKRPRGETLMVKVTPLEAREIQEAIREAAKQEKSLATLPALSRILEPFRGQGLIANTDQIRDAISKIVQYVIKVRKTPKLRSAQRKSGFDVEEVLVTIVQILENSGMSSLLAQIATELENRGQFDAADVLRNALGRSGSSKRVTCPDSSDRF